MKKIIILIIGIFVLTGCNYEIIDTKYTFDYALCNFDGIPERIEIEKWTDYDDGEQIQIKTKDGKVYLVSSFYCVLVDE